MSESERVEGRIWWDGLPALENWKASSEVLTIHRTVDSNGIKCLILFFGLYQIRMAMSEDGGGVATLAQASTFLVESY